MYQGYIIDGRNQDKGLAVNPNHGKGRREKATLSKSSGSEEEPEWLEVELPFEKFMLTKEGRVSEVQVRAYGLQMRHKAG